MIFFLKTPVTLRYMMFCQVIGETKIKMIAVTECENKCPVKNLILKSGEIRKLKLKLSLYHLKNSFFL
jgi:hypothetical protein